MWRLLPPPLFTACAPSLSGTDTVALTVTNVQSQPHTRTHTRTDTPPSHSFRNLFTCTLIHLHLLAPFLHFLAPFLRFLGPPRMVLLVFSSASVSRVTCEYTRPYVHARRWLDFWTSWSSCEWERLFSLLCEGARTCQTASYESCEPVAVEKVWACGCARVSMCVSSVNPPLDQ